MISESLIDQVIQELDVAGDYNKRLQALVEDQEAIVSYLESEGFEILSDDERDLMWYLTVVVYESVRKSEQKVPIINVDAIEAVEERNYSALESEHMKFTEIADLFFREYPEEDLLAFVEDTVIPDDEEFPSPIGRKVIFMTMKTLIDVLTVVN